MRYERARGFDTKLGQLDRRVNGEMFAYRPEGEVIGFSQVPEYCPDLCE